MNRQARKALDEALLDEEIGVQEYLYLVERPRSFVGSMLAARRQFFAWWLA